MSTPNLTEIATTTLRNRSAKMKHKNPDRMNEKSVKPTGYDRSGHYPGNPGFNREGKPPYQDYDAGAHAKQARGHPIGAGTPSTNKPIANIKPGGSDMGNKEVANTGPADRGSRLVEKTSEGHFTKTGVHGIGVGSKPRLGETMGQGSGAFRGMSSNPLRCTNNGHRIGARKK